MEKRVIFIVIICLLMIQCLFAQISTNEKPISFTRELDVISNSQAIDKIFLPAIDADKLLKEDSISEKDGKAPRFGYPHMVNYTIDNSGSWQVHSSGDKIWRLSLHCPNATSINLLYDKFWLPEGGKLFIYTPDKKHSLGAFTSKNNKGNKVNTRGFATGLLPGDEIVLEYFQPSTVMDSPIISICTVVHGYKRLYSNFILNYRGSSPDQVDINCYEGYDWQKEKRAVALIIADGWHYGSGFLVNNTAHNHLPLFITANHNLNGLYDAVTSPNMDQCTIYWKYERNNCNDSTETNPSPFSTSGATLLANSENSDFALLQLSEDPLTASASYLPYYLGWDCTGLSGTGGVSIHHPNGDVKKIATYFSTPTNNSPYWSVYFSETLNGFSKPEEGSSGGPLLNNAHKVIGQLKGVTNNNNSNFLYGRLVDSWSVGNSQQRLKDWLNPTGPSIQVIDGEFPCRVTGSPIVCGTEYYSISNLRSNSTIQWSTTNTNLQLVSGQGTANASFQKNGNGECGIVAQIFCDNILYYDTLKVWCGTPTAPTVTGWPHTNILMANTEYNFASHGNSQAQIFEYQWIVVKGATLISGGNTSNATFLMNSAGPVTIKVRARNACGWSPYTSKSGGITDDNGLIPINSPGNNIVSIPLSVDGEYEIQLWNTNRMIRSTKATKSSYDVDLSNFPSDLYVIKVLKDGQIVNQLKVRK